MLMSKKYIGIILFLLLSLFPTCLLSAQTNAGFVSGNIWYSKDPFEEGDKIQIYTLIFNPDLRELSGTVLFFDKTILLGKKTFVVASKAAKAISIDWTVSVGDHTIFAKIENSKFLISKDKYEEVYLTENQTAESSRSVNKKIILKVDDTSSSTQNETANTGGQIQNIEKFVIENTPNFISKPIVLGAETLEEFRSNIGVIYEKKKDEVQTEISLLKEDKIPPDSTDKVSPVLKPLKYIQLFFLSISSLILNSRVAFYSILVLVIFFTLRYFLRLIFS